MTIKSTSLLEAALKIRAETLKIIVNEGELESTDVGQFLTWEDGELSIAHYSSFQLFPTPGEDILSQGDMAGMDARCNFPNSLEIWNLESQVLYIEWNHMNHVELKNFIRGEWEEEVLQHI